MRLSNVIKGLQILSNYFDSDTNQTAAEHDEFFVYSTDHSVSKEDIKTLIEMGWFQDNGANLDNIDAYDPEESWKMFT